MWARRRGSTPQPQRAALCRRVLITASRSFLAMAINIFRSRGGRASKSAHVPADSEGFALATALSMLFADETDNTHAMFYLMISNEVKRLRGSLQEWTPDEIKTHVQEKLWKKIPAGQLYTYFEKVMRGLAGDERVAAKAEVVSCTMYLYLTYMSESGASYEQAMDLAREARIADLLKSRALGGHPSWELDDRGLHR